MNNENNNQANVKYCTKCGNQILTEATFCDKCGTQFFDSQMYKTQNNNFTPNFNQHTLAKKKFNKIYIIIPIIVIASILIAFVVAYFVLPNDSASTNSNSNSSASIVLDTSIDTDCPEDEYGHHSWSNAYCTTPSYCYNCGAYKDDKLGNHNFSYDEDADIVECIYCGMLKEVYLNELDKD